MTKGQAVVCPFVYQTLAYAGYKGCQPLRLLKSGAIRATV